MPQIIVLPHGEICPEGAVIDANSGDNLIELILDNGIALEHACEMACACTTCHVVVREGFDSLAESEELEDDLLDKAWGLEAVRLRLVTRILSSRFRNTPLIRCLRTIKRGDSA